jgi:hypothetical protein
MSDSSESDGLRRCTGKGCGRKPVGEFNFNGQQSRDGRRWLSSKCRDCERDAKRIVKRIRKLEGPLPEFCQNCKENPPTCCDHDHRTGELRGWLCGTCNRGLGMLGDDLAGVLRAAAYLERSSAPSSGSSASERERSRSPRSPRRHDDSGGETSAGSSA